MIASKEPKKYSILPKSSVLLNAESIGINDLSDEVIEVVCQDVNYHLRELLQVVYFFESSIQKIILKICLFLFRKVLTK